MKITAYFFAFLALLLANISQSQEIPSSNENIKSLTCFGPSADGSWGDDDGLHIFFFMIPKDYNKPVYVKVFDPETGGNNDQEVGSFNTSTKFTIYGGKGAYTTKAARMVKKLSGYNKGTLLYSKSYSGGKSTDNKWNKLSSVNPKQGEYVEQYDAYVFKIVVEGISGDDGNHFKLAISSNAQNSTPIPGANWFTFEYSFQLPTEKNSLVHLYPFIDNSVDRLSMNTFDFDNDGYIKVYSVAKAGHSLNVSGDNAWSSSIINIKDKERNKSMDIRISKTGSKSNDMVVYILNQYNEPVPFFASPLGGRPQYKYDVKIEMKSRNK